MIAELWCRLFGHKRKERVVVKTTEMMGHGMYRIETKDWAWEYYSDCPRCGERIKTGNI